MKAKPQDVSHGAAADCSLMSVLRICDEVVNTCCLRLCKHLRHRRGYCPSPSAPHARIVVLHVLTCGPQCLTSCLTLSRPFKCWGRVHARHDINDDLYWRQEVLRGCLGKDNQRVSPMVSGVFNGLGGIAWKWHLEILRCPARNITTHLFSPVGGSLV